MRPPEPVDDGLIIPEVGSWSETKYSLVALYSTLFSTSMRAKWENRVYIDLYAGAGISRNRSNSRLMCGSPLLTVAVPHPFDNYIFCEENSEKLLALEKRVRRLAPQANATFIHGDCNDKVQEILAAIPKATPGNKVLSFCFADPFDLSLRFSTIEALAQRYTDFLVLLALYMDANRNYTNYLNEKSTKVARFLGDDSWRERWATEQMQNPSFPSFLASEFKRRMISLSYEPPPPMKEVRSDDKNLPLYHLAIFSRHQRAYEFWDQVLKYSTSQMGLF